MGSKREKHKIKLAYKQRPVQMELVNIPDSNGMPMQIYAQVGKPFTVQRNRRQLAVGVWRHPQAELWQVWYSVAGNDITWVSSHQDLKEANQNVEEIKLADAQKNLNVALFQRLAQARAAPPENMSITEIVQVIASIPRET
jgi:hypothetical protein